MEDKKDDVLHVLKSKLSLGLGRTKRPSLTKEVKEDEDEDEGEGEGTRVRSRPKKGWTGTISFFLKYFYLF